MKLREGETVAAAWAEECHGPGWSNRVVWVLVRGVGGDSLRVDSIQPEEQSPVLAALFSVSDVVQREVAAEVTRIVKESR